MILVWVVKILSAQKRNESQQFFQIYFMDLMLSAIVLEISLIMDFWGILFEYKSQIELSISCVNRKSLNSICRVTIAP